MTDRTIAARPPTRPTAQTTASAPSKSSPSRKKTAVSSQQPEPPKPSAPKYRESRVERDRQHRRRRVHATVRREVAAGLRRQVTEGSVSNTSVLIAALEADRNILAAKKATSPFAERSKGDGREGIYFYFGRTEIQHIDSLSKGAGFETRSAFIDAVLERHLLAS